MMPTVAMAAPKERSGTQHVVDLLRPRRAMLALIVGLFVGSATLEVVPPLVIRQIVDQHLLVDQPTGLLALALLYLGAVATLQALGGLATYLTSVVAERTLQALRVRLFAHLQALPIGFYDRVSLGDVMSRCTADVEAVDTLFSSGVAKAVADLFRLVTVAVAMVLLSPVLALVTALIGPPILLITRFLQVRVRAAERRNRRAVGMLNAHLQEGLGGVEMIRATGAEPRFVRRFRLAVRETLLAYNASTVYAALYMPLMATLAALATALLLWVGTRDVLVAWGVSIGTLTAFLLLFQQFFAPITSLGDEWQTVQGALSGAERIFQILGLPIDAPPTVQTTSVSEMHASGTASSAVARPSIEVSGVVFGYLPDRPVLHHVTLTVCPGEHVALVGRTGAGKSSIVHLLGGLYGPWSGHVRVDGLDPRGLTTDDRRRIIGVVPQVVQLVSGTVLENLTLYDQSVEREAVERAARDTGADRLIAALPEGYATILGGSGRGQGVQLSAGQRQLISLTRALVWSPRVLLLDEATAAVDGTSDAAVRAGLRVRTTRDGMAVLTVAHRLSTAREADRVIVLEDGRIVEEGAPDRLVQQGGRFAALVEIEEAGWDWQAGVAQSSGR